MLESFSKTKDPIREVHLDPLPLMNPTAGELRKYSPHPEHILGVFRVGQRSTGQTWWLQKLQNRQESYPE